MDFCFVDFEKAFDRVNWAKMFEILENLHIDWKDRRLLQDLYMRQEAVVRIANEESDPGIIGRGVRQGCPMSPPIVLNLCRSYDNRGIWRF